MYYAADYKNHAYAIELFEQAGVEVIQVMFDERKIDFLSAEKSVLYMEMLEKLREKGGTEEEIAHYTERVSELFGEIEV